MNWLKKIFTALGPRAIGVGASLISGVIISATKGVVNVSPADVVQIAGTMLGTYAVAHRVVSAVGVNPGDAASPTLVEVDKDLKAEAVAQQPKG